MSSEDKIFDIYNRLQRKPSPVPPVLDPVGGINIPSNKYSPNTEVPRWNWPSFRSQWFDVGRGLVTLAPGETLILADMTIPIGHLGVLTGFTQYFADCEELIPSIINSITWGLRINGDPIRNFPDFVGQLSTPWHPRHVFYPLLGEMSGNVSTSPGGSPQPQTPTVYMQATNNLDRSVILSSRIIGHSFPIDERADEFGSY